VFLPAPHNIINIIIIIIIIGETKADLHGLYFHMYSLCMNVSIEMH